MEKKETIQIYFGKEGITSTSANFVANVAKEMIRQEQSDIDNVDFISESMMTATSDVIHQTKQGDDENILMSLPQKAEHIAEIKSLIGWLREAIKAKENMIKEIERKPYEDIAKILGVEEPKSAEEITGYTEDEFIKTLSEAEQRKIQLLNTKAAIYGKLIHEKGALGKARKRVLDCKHAASEVQKTLGVIAIVERTPTVEIEKIDSVYFELQNKYREVQKELNSLIFKAKDEMHKANMALEAERIAKIREYNQKENEYFAVIEKWRKQEIKRIADLRIVIPQELQSIYNEVNSK